MTLIVVIVVIFVAGLLLAIRQGDGDVVFGWVLGGGFGCAVVYMVAASSLQGIMGYRNVYENFPIVALSDERTSTGGEFFLGSGSVGTSAAFEFYVDNGGGARQLYQIPSDGILVYEDITGDARPYAVWAQGRTNNHNGVSWCFYGCSRTGLVELHVPAHSIKEGIVLGVKQPS